MIGYGYTKKERGNQIHVIQLLLVQAESAEHALSIVTACLPTSLINEARWADWYEIGGGRWKGIFEGWSENEEVLKVTENRILAEDLLDKFLGFRKRDIDSGIENYIKQTGITDIRDITKILVKDGSPKGGLRYSYADWNLLQSVKLLNDEWTSDSGIRDYVEGTGSLVYFYERLDKNPDEQYIVPVDFHC